MSWEGKGWKQSAKEYRESHHAGGNGYDELQLIQLEIMRLAKLGVAAYEVERAAAAKARDARFRTRQTGRGRT